LLAVIMCALLVSCGGERTDANESSDDTVDVSKIKAVTVPCYDFSYSYYNKNDERFKDTKPLDDYKTGDYEFLYIDGENEILYTTLSVYTSLLSRDLRDDYVAKTTTSGGKPTYTVTYEGEEGEKGVVFEVTFDPKEKKIYGKGIAEEVFKEGDIYETTLNDGLLFKFDTIGKDGKSEFSFKNYGFKTFEYNNEVYFPFSVIDFRFQKETGRHFLYARHYNMLFEYAEEDQKKVAFTSSDISDIKGELTIDKVVTSSYEENYPTSEENGNLIVTPQYMVEYTNKLFYYAMDNYYGLETVLGYESMSEYFGNTTYAKGFLSPSAEMRAYAYGTAVSLLNDRHTIMATSEYLDEIYGFGYARYSQTLFGFDNFATDLMKEARAAEIEKSGIKEKGGETKVRYSSDGKTAYFSFDSFSASKKISDDILDGDDTYYLFVRNLNEIKNYGKAEGAEKGSVENVVIDASVNGGGVVLTMVKLMALMSSDNAALVYMRDESNGAVFKYYARVDSNNDGEYDEKDCFGQYFDFYVITSPAAFSCGNAFPYYLQKTGLAKIIGSKSGGGECAIGSIVFPFGQELTLSSLSHIGWYDEKSGEFEGDEPGADPDKEYYGNYYDVENIAELIVKMAE